VRTLKRCLFAVAIALALSACGNSADSSRGTHAAEAPGAEQVAARRADAKARTLFRSLCAVCHTLAAADAHGTVGPNFDEMRPTPAQLRDQVRRTIALPSAQERALIRYVRANAGKGGRRRP
jgi:cytochrome c6